MNTKYRIFFSSLVMTLMVILAFQNCGKGFEAGQMLGLQLASSSSTPELSLVSPIASLVNLRSLTISFRLNGSQSILSANCQLDSNPATDCASGSFNLSALADGDHVVLISAVGSSGSVVAPLTISFRVDATAPTLSILQTPASVSGSQQASIVFAATDAMSGIKSVQCSQDSGAYADCSSPAMLSGLASGAHSFKIKAIDNAGNVSPESVISWTVDLTAPIVSISNQPQAFSNSNSASISFSGSSSGSAVGSFECSQDSGPFAACTSPKALSGLSEGNHTLAVRVPTANANLNSAVSVAWMVDTVAPSAPVLTANIPASTAMTNASISFTASDAGSMVASYQCALDGAALAACASPKVISGLSLGSHLFQVKAIDNAGNISAAASFAWNVTAPTPTPSPVPTATPIPPTPTPGSGLACSFNGQPVNDGESVVAYKLAAYPFGSVPSMNGSRTVPELRTCSNGVLSGSFPDAYAVDLSGNPSSLPTGQCSFQTAQFGPAPNPLQPFSLSIGVTLLTNGQTTMAYAQGSPGLTCQASTTPLTCRNGIMISKGILSACKLTGPEASVALSGSWIIDSPTQNQKFSSNTVVVQGRCQPNTVAVISPYPSTQLPYITCSAQGTFSRTVSFPSAASSGTIYLMDDYERRSVGDAVAVQLNQPVVASTTCNLKPGFVLIWAVPPNWPGVMDWRPVDRDQCKAKCEAVGVVGECVYGESTCKFVPGYQNAETNNIGSFTIDPVKYAAGGCQ